MDDADEDWSWEVAYEIWEAQASDTEKIRAVLVAFMNFGSPYLLQSVNYSLECSLTQADGELYFRLLGEIAALEDPWLRDRIRYSFLFEFFDRREGYDRWLATFVDALSREPANREFLDEILNVLRDRTDSSQS